GERARNCGALLHASRKLLGIMMLKADQIDRLEPLAHDCRAPVRRCALFAQAKGDVVGDGEPWKQGIRLKDHATVGAWFRYGNAVEENPARSRLIQSGDEPQQCRLAAAGRTDDRDEIVVGNRKIRRLERERRRAPTRTWENTGNVVDDQVAHARLQGNSCRFRYLKRKREIGPSTRITMMPKIICPVESSAWLSVIMWPMPEDEPISSATIT